MSQSLTSWLKHADVDSEGSVDIQPNQAYSPAVVPPPLSVDIDRICLATASAKRASEPRLWAQVLSKPSDFVMCASGTA